MLPDDDHTNLVRAYAKCINSMNCTELDQILDDAAVMESQNVMQAMVGRGNIIDYWKNKFRTIETAGKQFRVGAELGEYNGRAAVVLSQSEEPVGVVLLKCTGKKINHIMLCSVAPRPQDVKGTGEFPT